MQYINETNNREVNFLLHPVNYTQFFNKLKTILSEKEIGLFAKPEVHTDTTDWLIDVNGDVKWTEYNRLGEEDSDSVADKLELQKGNILAKLSGIKELAASCEHIFKVPATQNIKAFSYEGEWWPILTQWGSVSNKSESQADPLSTLLFRPRNTTDMVAVNCAYKNGDIAAEKSFFINYNGKETREKSNDAGIYNRGRCKINSSFSVHDILDGNKISENNFTVSPGNSYQAVFSLFTDLKITVVDQNDLPLAGEPVFVNGTAYTTGGVGSFEIMNAEVGEDIELEHRSEKIQKMKISVNKNDKEYIFKLYCKEFASAKITVIDSKGATVPEFQLTSECEGESAVYTTDENGSILINGLQAGALLKLTGMSHTQEFVMTAVENEFIFRLAAEKEVQIKLIDKKNKPLAGIRAEFVYGKAKHVCTANEEGICILPFPSFIDREKVKVRLDLPKKGKKNAAAQNQNELPHLTQLK